MYSVYELSIPQSPQSSSSGYDQSWYYGPYAYTTATSKTTPSKKCVSIVTLDSDLSNVSVGIKNCPSWICYESIQFQIEIWKVRRCGSRSLDNAEIGHFRHCCFAYFGAKWRLMFINIICIYVNQVYCHNSTREALVHAAMLLVLSRNICYKCWWPEIEF